VKIRMKPHSGAQGIAAGLLLMAFTGMAESNTAWLHGVYGAGGAIAGQLAQIGLPASPRTAFPRRR
jgi:hypothetical protein